jgi:hypothetical protein
MVLRRLSESQARRCEEACDKRCRCRCGGALHGAKRARKFAGTTPREWFEQLPEDDPHKVRERRETPAQRKRRLKPRQMELELP